MKADVTLEFYCYIDAEGMMKFIRKPSDRQEQPVDDDTQEQLDLDAQVEEDVAEDEEVSEAIQQAVEEATEDSNEPVNIDDVKVKRPLTMTSLLDGVYTGKKFDASNFVSSKSEMRDLLDTEREGLRPLFILSVKDKK